MLTKIKIKIKSFLFILYYKIYCDIAPQEGEDLILQRFFQQKKTGFYVDIGAHHPVRYSNTYALYNIGWNGINVEPNSDISKEFKKLRTRDINLNYACSTSKEITFYKFDDPALNTTSPNIVELRKLQGFEYIEKKQVKCITLNEIFIKYVQNNSKNIDLLNIDTEGNELEILKSNNWDEFKPKVIICEILDRDIEDVLKSDISNYLKSKEYKIFSKLFHNVIFIHKDFNFETKRS